MTKEALDDDWWVIGNVETGTYLHWKGDAVIGCYVASSDPEDAKRYDTAEEARKAILEDKDVQVEISAWHKPAGPVHVKKGVIVSDDPEDGTPDVYSPAKRRARLLYCMDYLMHALSDEEAIVPWLQDACPDGTNEMDLQFQQLKPYLDLEVSDEDFDMWTGIFIKTLADQGGYGSNGKTDAETGKAVFA